MVHLENIVVIGGLSTIRQRKKGNEEDENLSRYCGLGDTS